MTWVKRKIYEKLIYPIALAKPSLEEFRIAVAVGLFVALLPIMGIQMYVCAGLWLLFKKFKKEWNFNLPTAIALVWITNPITIVPIYYFYFLIGNACIKIFTPYYPDKNFAFFESKLEEIQHADSFMTMIEMSVRFLFIDTGVPLLLGSLIVAIPCTILGFIYADKFYLKIEKFFNKI